MAKFYTPPTPKEWVAIVGDEWPPQVKQRALALLALLDTHFQGRPPEVTLNVILNKASQVTGVSATLIITDDLD